MRPRNDADPAFDGLEPPNHTQVPNALFDDLMCQMKEAELRVTLAICRYTFGWHKKEDEISLSRLQAMTGLSRQGVIQGIEAGMQRGVIRRRPRGQSFMYRLRLVNVVDQLSATNGAARHEVQQLVNVVDQPPDRTSQRSGPVVPPTSQLGGPELVNYVDTQKKGKKDHDPTTTDNGSNQDVVVVDSDFYMELRKRKVGQAKARQIAAMTCDPARILALIDRRADPTNPATLGGLINDILEGVIDAQPPRAVAKNAPLTATRPNVPETTVAPAEMLRIARERR